MASLLYSLEENSSRDEKGFLLIKNLFFRCFTYPKYLAKSTAKISGEVIQRRHLVKV